MEPIIENTQKAVETTSAGVEVQASEVQSVEHEMTVLEGVELSAVGMGIVFTGLVLTFCYISSLKYISGDKQIPFMQSLKPKAKPAHPDVAKGVHDTLEAKGKLEPELQAAIAYVIAAEREYERMTDYHKITIRRDENQQVWGVAGKMRTLATRKISKNR
jgi:Na+-transporting methylmalonyl-CoA/oxaloacetate decarboxylase gamma subunit